MLYDPMALRMQFNPGKFNAEYKGSKDFLPVKDNEIHISSKQCVWIAGTAIFSLLRLSRTWGIVHPCFPHEIIRDLTFSVNKRSESRDHIKALWKPSNEAAMQRRLLVIWTVCTVHIDHQPASRPFSYSSECNRYIWLLVRRIVGILPFAMLRMKVI